LWRVVDAGLCTWLELKTALYLEDVAEFHQLLDLREYDERLARERQQNEN
jgi:hypothetical protein